MDKPRETDVFVTARASHVGQSQGALLIELKRYRMASGEGPLETETVSSVEQATEVFRSWLTNLDAS